MKAIKGLAVATSLLVIGSSGLGLVGCGKRAVSIDSGKTQLTVKWYDGGYGHVWLDKLIENFEATYAETSFEPNKKGVQILKDFNKTGVQVSQIKDYGAEVFIVEHVNYGEAVNRGALLDISDVVTGKAPKLDGTEENKTIESKLHEDEKGYYGRTVEGKTVYYALPTFAAWHDMIYNMDLFKNEGYYFNSASDAKLADFDQKFKTDIAWFEDTAETSKYFTDDVTDLSKGPDGEANTVDDGLPATYAEFKMLLEYIAQSSSESIVPFVTNGNAHHYFATWANDIWANYEGKENMMMHLNLSSGGKKVDNLVTLEESGGSYIEKAQPAIEITPENAYYLQRQKGKLEALRFMEMIFSDSRYYEEDVFNSNYQHTSAQNHFINGNSEKGKQYAILMDGNWWNNEGKDYFKNNSYYDVNFGVIPVPKVDSTHIGEAQTKIDGYISKMFIKSSIKESKIEVAKEFLSYINSDEALCVFSEFTQSVRNMKYDIDEGTLSRMTEYGRQIYRTFNSDKFNVIAWDPRSSEAQKNSAYLDQKTYGWSSKSYGADNPGDVLYKKNVSAEAYFTDIVNKWTSQQWAITYLK